MLSPGAQLTVRTQGRSSAARAPSSSLRRQESLAFRSRGRRGVTGPARWARVTALRESRGVRWARSAGPWGRRGSPQRPFVPASARQRPVLPPVSGK